jgi:VWFA-related protein
VLFLALVAAANCEAAQAPAGQNADDKEVATEEVQAPFELQVQRNVVLVRVIVRDSNGRPIPGLRKGDFRLFDNGKPQEIDQFAVESSGATPAVTPQALGKEETVAGSKRASSEATPRNYQALYFDDVHMNFEDIVHVRDAADRYLAATLAPANRVGIFTSSGQTTLDFSDDRSMLHETLFKLAPRPIYTREPNVCPDITEYQAHMIVDQGDPNAMAIATSEYDHCNCVGLPKLPREACEAQAPQMVQQESTKLVNSQEAQDDVVLRGLEQVVRRTALLPGQRSVIFLSPGFLFFHLEPVISGITKRALRSKVVVNSLDARGLYAVIPGGAASEPAVVIPPSGALAGRKDQLIRDGYSLAEDVLYGLAADTGGLFFHNSNDFDLGFRQVGTISEVSYVLAFTPLNLKPDGQFHKLEVSLVNANGFTVQARRGYFAPPPSENAAARASEEIVDAAFSQDQLRDLPIDVSTQFYKINESGFRLAVVTHMDLSTVRFEKEQDRNLNDLTFVTILFDRDGKYVVGREKKVLFRLRDASLTKLTQSGISLKMEFDVKPGTYLVREIVRESRGGRLSGLTRTVELPE